MYKRLEIDLKTRNNNTVIRKTMIGNKLMDEDLEDCMQDAIIFTLKKWNFVDGKEKNIIVYCINKYENLQRDLLLKRSREVKYSIR